MDKMQPISQALYSLLFLGCMGAGFPLYVQGQNVDELPPDSIYNIGYARGSLKNISGSVEQITEKQMNRELITNPLEAIQGRVPGLTILKSNNGMAALESVRLRGTTSLTSGNDPLIIVDGVLGDLTMLTSVYPTDIESFTILKDASETAQYGSRGASGVINIVTKKGRAGKTRVNYNGSLVCRMLIACWICFREQSIASWRLNEDGVSWIRDMTRISRKPLNRRVCSRIITLRFMGVVRLPITGCR